MNTLHFSIKKNQLKMMMSTILIFLFAQVGFSQDCCDQGNNLVSITLKYSGEDCGFSNTSQESGDWFCLDINEGLVGDDEVYIIVADDDANIYFYGNVALDSTFTATAASANVDNFPSNIYFFIYDNQGGLFRQFVEISTSCSQPLLQGDQFGSLILEDVKFDNGNTCNTIFNTNCDCESGIYTVTFMYNGPSGIAGRVYDHHDNELGYWSNLVSGQSYSFDISNTNHSHWHEHNDPIFWTYENGEWLDHGTMDSSCETDVIGDSFGPYTIISWIDLQGNQCPNYLPVDIANCNCESGIYTVTFMYNGPSGIAGRVYDHHDNEFGYWSNLVSGQSYSFDISDTNHSHWHEHNDPIFWTYENGEWVDHGTMDSSCGTNVISDSFGPFTITGWTDLQGNQCPNDSPVNIVNCNCESGIYTVTFMYNGPSGIEGRIYEHHDNELGYWSNLVSGQSYSFDISNTDHSHWHEHNDPIFWTYENGEWENHGTMDSSCETDVIGDSFGPFTIIGWIDLEGNQCVIQCDNVTAGGLINGDEINCDPYDPEIIMNVEEASGNSNPSGGNFGDNGQDCCDQGDKPNKLTFTYVGGSCPGNNSQDDKSECIGGSVNSSSVFITASEKKNGDGDIYFSSLVTLGSSFTFDNDGDKFKSELFIEFGNQENEIHTSCSESLISGETYGALRLDFIEFENNVECGLPPDPPTNYQWISSTSGCPTNIDQAISGATNLTYNPPFITQTTWYVRLAKREFCDDDQIGVSEGWIASNCVIKEVEDCDPGSNLSVANLLNFEAKKEGVQSNISWVMNRDINVDFYDVEVSTNGEDFELLESVDSDQVNAPREYKTKDYNPTSGENFYRLKVVNMDGAHFYSNKRRLNFDIDFGNIIVYPNPTNNLLNVLLNDFAGQEGTVEVFNSLGQKQFSQKYLSLPTIPMTLDVSKYAPGIYTISIKVDNQRRFAKQFVVMDK